MMIHARGFRKLITALYPEGDPYLSSDAVSGVKKSLVVVSSESKGYPQACPHQLLYSLFWRVDLLLCRNSSKSMTKLRHGSVDSRRVQSSSYSSMISSSSLRTNGWLHVPMRYCSIELRLKLEDDLRM
jgi:hypothetical protein